MINIAIIHLSRGRPAIAKATAEAWLSPQCPPCFDVRCHYFLGVEDVEFDAYQAQDFPGTVDIGRVNTRGKVRLDHAQLDSSLFSWPSEREIAECYSTANTKCRAVTLAVLHRLDIAYMDWIVYIADNLYPVGDWLAKLSPYLYEHAGKPAVLGYHYHVWRKLLSHPIVSREFALQQKGEIQYCGYYHTHGDAELFLQAGHEGALVTLPPELDPTHHHPYHDGIPADDLFRLNNHAKVYQQGEEVFARRRARFIK
jgi:hypothetical protein